MLLAYLKNPGIPVGIPRCHLVMEPKVVNGQRIYLFYRGTPLGESLLSVIDEFKDCRMITEAQIEIISDEFDRAMTEALSKVDDSQTVQITGTPVDFKRVNNYYQMFLEPATLVFPEKTVTSKCLEVVAVHGKEVKGDDVKKSGRKKKNT